jgi:protein ImuB
MLEQLCARLAARSLATNALRLACRLDPVEDPETPSRRTTAKNKDGSSGLGEEGLFVRTLKLPVPMQDPRVLLKLLQLDLAAHPPGAPVEKLALRAEPVRPRTAQDGFFVPIAPEPEKLELLLARVAALVGEGNVGAAEVLDSHRPDAHGIRKFQVSELQQRDRGSGLGPRAATQLALRLFRPPLRARVEAQAGAPARVSFLALARAEVLGCAGPWRTSGEWWTSGGWRRDEWDVALRTTAGAALYRMYRDLDSGDWFVYGSYD